MASCEEVKVYMENGLASTGIGIVDDPVTVLGHAFFPGEMGCGLEDMADKVIVVWHESERADNVFSRHDEKVYGRNWRDVLNGNYQFILVNFLGGNLVSNYFAEDAIIHRVPSCYRN